MNCVNGRARAQVFKKTSPNGRKRLTFAFKQFVVFRLTPGFLLETGATPFAVVPASVVLAAAYEFVRICRVCYIAKVGMTVAPASASDAHVLDRVKVLHIGNKRHVALH